MCAMPLRVCVCVFVIKLPAKYLCQLIICLLWIVLIVLLSAYKQCYYVNIKYTLVSAQVNTHTHTHIDIYTQMSQSRCGIINVLCLYIIKSTSKRLGRQYKITNAFILCTYIMHYTHTHSYNLLYRMNEVYKCAHLS